MYQSGAQPEIQIWDVASASPIARIGGGVTSAAAKNSIGLTQPHKYGIAHVAFHPTCPQYLVSIGVQHDGLIHLWDWKKNIRLASAKVTNKVHTSNLFLKKEHTKGIINKSTERIGDEPNM